ncbi:hypothetical protein [Caproicibacter sp. BJN0012]|uniref:hypothetical protein n=1 Tax=Caproicibacter sp. BJN0012 TaxID=3110227 RepID=UPI002E13F889
MMKHLRNDRGDMTFTTCFIMLALVMLVSFLLLFFSVQINCINIRNGIKMELNNLTASIYADTYRSQRETDLDEYVSTLYSSSSYTHQLEQKVEDGLAKKIPLETEDYRIKNIRLEFTQDGNDQIEYIFTCDTEFYVIMFGNRYPIITREIRLTGHHNTKF